VVNLTNDDRDRSAAIRCEFLPQARGAARSTMLPYRAGTTALKYHITQNPSKGISKGMKAKFLIFVPCLTSMGAAPTHNAFKLSTEASLANARTLTIQTLDDARSKMEN
jgi:hypothetical protein